MTKGIILAGGTGSRLTPMTNVISKHLIPVYDKPMIHYPLGTLMLAGVKEILLIGTPHDLPRYQQLLGDGRQFGLSISYAEQAKANGIAEAFTLGKDFIGDENVWLILGDNIFFGPNLRETLINTEKNNTGATIFGYWVKDPKRFGVIEYDENYNVLSLAEKPEQPKSHYAAVGLYYYDNSVIEKAANLKPSARGELEITDLNNLYFKEGNLRATPLQRGFSWFDTGTPASLLEAANYFAAIERIQGLKVNCLEEIAWRTGNISTADIRTLIENLSPSADYTAYLKDLLQQGVNDHAPKLRKVS